MGELSFTSVILIVMETVLIPLLGEVPEPTTLKACMIGKKMSTSPPILCTTHSDVDGV